MEKTNIYTLRLKNNKYYVGKTTQDIQKRFEQHIGKTYGSLWTKIHKPIEILEIFKNVSPFEEDKIVKEYMYKFGINNVRGGSYILPNLKNTEKKLLEKEIRMAKDLCIRCGGDHFIKYCKEMETIEEDDEDEDEEYLYECEICNCLFKSEEICREHLNNCVEKKDNYTQTDDEEEPDTCCCIIC